MADRPTMYCHLGGCCCGGEDDCGGSHCSCGVVLIMVGLFCWSGSTVAAGRCIGCRRLLLVVVVPRERGGDERE